MQANDLDRARDALQSLDPNCDRAAWVKTGMAFHAAGGDFDTFDQWSAPAGNYNAQACRDTWRSFKTAPGGVGAGALFGMARDHSWTEGKASPFEAPLKPARPPGPVRWVMPSMSASEVWGRCQPATADHPYITAKSARGVPLDGLRVAAGDDPLRIMGESMAGALVLPCWGADGALSTLQFVTAGATAARLKAAGKTTKPNLPGHSVQGWHTVGEIKPGEPVYVCEGVGTAWACWMATGAAAVACFGWGNVSKVAAALRQKMPDAKLIICPDTGKEAAAEKVAAEVGAAVAAMPEGWPDNSDLNDLFQSPDGGFDVVQALLESATEPPKPEPLLKPVSVFDILTHPSPPPAFVWADYLPRTEVALLSAHGGTGKSTIALMLAVCAVLGRPLFGVDTEQCNVVFVSLEDGAGIVRHRLASICRAWLIDPVQLHGRLHIVDGTEHPELFTAEAKGQGDVTSTYAELCALVQAEAIGLVLIDNASDAYAGDEIQRKQVRGFIRKLKEIAKSSNAAVLLLSHVDKGTSRARKAEGGEGYSGSTAWHNSVRSRLFLSRGEDGLLTLEHQKSNLGRMREPLTLEWLEGGFPQVVQSGGFDTDGFGSLQTGKADDDRAAALLKLIAEFEGREQYASPSPTARNNVHNLLKSEPAFIALKLRPDDTKRIVNQCQRAKWIEPLDYRSKHTNKSCQRWAMSPEGRLFAGLSAASPTAPTAPTCHFNDVDALGANGGAPTAPTCAGGTGDRERTDVGAKEGATA